MTPDGDHKSVNKLFRKRNNGVAALVTRGHAVRLADGKEADQALAKKLFEREIAQVETVVVHKHLAHQLQERIEFLRESRIELARKIVSDRLLDRLSMDALERTVKRPHAVKNRPSQIIPESLF
jgi:methyltransferase-like protein